MSTNDNRRTQPAKPASAQVEPLVDAVVICSHEGFAKPDPRDFPEAVGIVLAGGSRVQPETG